LGSSDVVNDIKKSFVQNLYTPSKVKHIKLLKERWVFHILMWSKI